MAIAHLQDWGVTASSSTASAQSGAAGSALTNPSTIIVFIWYFKSGGTSVSSVTDTAGNTYVKDARVGNAANHNFCEVWSAQNTTTTASNKITVNMNAAALLTFCA